MFELEKLAIRFCKQYGIDENDPQMARLINAFCIGAKIESERCAKVCEEKHVNGNWKYDTRHECAEAIRERSNTALGVMDTHE